MKDSGGGNNFYADVGEILKILKVAIPITIVLTVSPNLMLNLTQVFTKA